MRQTRYIYCDTNNPETYLTLITKYGFLESKNDITKYRDGKSVYIITIRKSTGKVMLNGTSTTALELLINLSKDGIIEFRDKPERKLSYDELAAEVERLKKELEECKK